MHRFIRLSCICVCAIVLTACYEIEERLRLERDGSGERMVTLDFAGVLANPLFRQGMESSMDEQGLLGQRVDSSFSLYTELEPVNPQWTDEERALIVKVEGRIFLDLDEQRAFMSLRYPFEDPEELDRIDAIVREANTPEGEDENPFGDLVGAGAARTAYTHSRKTLARRTEVDESLTQVDEMGAGMGELMREMLDGASYTLVMEMPGRVRSVDGYTGHTLDGETLTVSLPLLDMVEREGTVEELSGTIKYRRR